jgi:hypothetical protein
MTDETGAAAPESVPAVTAPAAPETAKPDAGVPTDAAPEAETKAKPDEGADKPEAETGDESEDKPHKLSRNQRLQRKAARLAGVVAEQAARLEELEKKSTAGLTDDAPKEADYNGDYTAYLTDLAAHKAANKISAKIDERDKRSETEKLNASRQEAYDDFEDRVEKVRGQIPDYDSKLKALFDSVGQLAPHVVEELHESDKGPELLYSLASQPHKVAELNRMSARDAAREIGRLEAKVSLPQAKRQTQAAAPLTTPKGGASPPFDPNKSDDMNAYVNWRKQGGGTTRT